jgi:hypothetical protein
LERIGIHSVSCQQSKKFRFAGDSPLEGFEPSVPRRRDTTSGANVRSSGRKVAPQDRSSRVLPLTW